jgi:hypothetical protein
MDYWIGQQIDYEDGDLEQALAIEENEFTKLT